METEKEVLHLWNEQKTRLSVRRLSATDNQKKGVADADRPGLVWLGGFRSDMTGSKAETMVSTARELGASALRFDYSGHGMSGGRFVEGTISRWVSESLQVVREETSGPQILLGSSMGGWIALRLVQELQKLDEESRVAGLILIAPAPDFTQELMEPEFSAVQRKALDQSGFFEEASAYSDEPNVITKQLIEDGRTNCLLDSSMSVDAPVRILQGRQDPDVPWRHVMRLLDLLVQDDVTVTLIKDGDHRLSREQDLDLLQRTIVDMVDSNGR